MTDSSRKAQHRSSRVRFAPVAVLGAVAASAAIALSMSGTLAGFVAQITNNNNTAAAGTLVMQETQTVGGVTTTCNSNSGSTGTNTASCATINKYGGSSLMVPGVGVASTVKIANTGTVPANTFTIGAGACSQPALAAGAVNGGATDACSKFQVSVTQDGAPVSGLTNVSLASIATKTFTLAGPVAGGASSTFVFTVVLPVQATTANPTADNPYQGIQVKQDLVWTFTS